MPLSVWEMQAEGEPISSDLLSASGAYNVKYLTQKIKNAKCYRERLITHINELKQDYFETQ